MKVRVWWRWWIAALLALGLALASLPPAAAQALRTWRISFEVLSSLHAQPPAGVKPTYEQKERFVHSTLAEIVPHVWATLGAVATRARSRVRPGGYHDQINPAIHSNIVTSEGEARRLAAALGYVFRQYAVLVYDLRPVSGDVRFVNVRFPRGTLTTARAARYFGRARAELKSDKLGFSALGSRMVFINLGTGIADDAFVAGLKRAAAPEPEIKIEGPSPARAVLIENDWEKAKQGENYAQLLGPNSERIAAVLSQLRRRHDGRVRRWMQFRR